MPWTIIGSLQPLLPQSNDMARAVRLATGEVLWPGEITRRILTSFDPAAFVLFDPTGNIVRASGDSNDLAQWNSALGTPNEVIRMAPKAEQTGVSVEWESITYDVESWTDYANEFGNILIPRLPRKSVFSLLNEAIKHMMFEGVIILVNQNNGYVEFRRYSDASGKTNALAAIPDEDLSGQHLALGIVRPVENTSTSPFET